jgi:hypothetical protein
MIDTIKLAYPMDKALYRLLNENAEKLQKVAPDGEVLWEKSVVRGDCMPSHYSGLRITTRTKRDLIEMGFDPDFINCDKDVAFFEFSLQKFQSPSAYNNHNSSIENDLLALADWVKQLSAALGYIFALDRFELYRVDLSQNYMIRNAHPTDVIRCMELHLSRNPEADSKTERYGHMVALRSNWIGKKLYYKGQEFMDVERKKHRHIYSDAYMAGERENLSPCLFRPLSSAEIDDLMSMLRFELEFKRSYLKRYGMTKIISITSLVERFNNEKTKFINVPVISRGEIDSLSPQEHQLIDCIRVHGFQAGKFNFINRYSERTFYRIRRSLQARSIPIHLEAMENMENRLTGQNVFFNPERHAFQFDLAPFLEPFKKAA